MADFSDYRTQPEPPVVPMPDMSPEDEVTVLVDSDDGAVTVIEQDTGFTKTENDDGSVTIDLAPTIIGGKKSSKNFDSNLAEYLDDSVGRRIASEILEGIESDDQSRQEWLQNRAKGIEMLGFKLDEPRGDAGASTSPVEGMSTVRHTLLAEAVVRFQSNAAAELLPAEGPVKVRDDRPIPPLKTAPDGTPTPEGAPPAPGPSAPGTPIPTEPEADADGDQPSQDLSITRFDLAEALEKGFNHILTVVDKGYRPDTDRMLFWTGYGGCGFKKVYHDPIRRMPLSRSVDAQDLIVSDAANDINDAARVTHVIKMRKSQLIRMQIAGVYLARASTLPQPQETTTPVEQKIALTMGFRDMPQRPQDMDYTIYECYCELDLPGFEHEDEEGNPSGLPLPYRVSIDRDSREILEIRRNWREDDPNCLPRRVFVKYPFIHFGGFYDIGLFHLLGNADRALTAAWRIALDAGMFANFPGFIYSDMLGRQNTNEFRVPPGGGIKINTGGKPIEQIVMPLPYKDVSQGLLALSKIIEEDGQRLGGTAELQVAEGRQEAPVGTTLAMIEQATKMLAAVHVRLHAAQAEEFQLLKERYREDPTAFWRNNKNSMQDWQEEEFLRALNDYDLVPAADPNTPSHMHRVMKAVAIKQLQMANPAQYNGRAVDTLILRMIGVNPNGLFVDPNTQGAAPPDPRAMMVAQKMQAMQQEAANKAADRQADLEAAASQAHSRAMEVGTESADRAADRQSRERVAATRERTEAVKALAKMVQDGQIHPDVLLRALNVSADQAGHASIASHVAAENAWQTGEPPPPPAPPRVI